MKRSPYIYYALLLVFVVMAYWQLALLQHPLMWDAMQAFFPWRYFIAECVRNGHLPLWNPYELCGYPFFADPQSGAWYPVALLAGFLGRYSIYTFQLEYVFTVFVGGAGMFQLIKSFGRQQGAALFGAMCFAACGFFVGNAEHTSWLVSAAWITWLLSSYHNLLQTQKYGYALLCAVFLALLLCGGYPAFLIVTGYIILTLFLSGIFAKRHSKQLPGFVKTHFIFALAFILLTSVFVYSFAGSTHFMTRGNGLTLQKANGMPFSPQCLLSLLLPFSSIKNDGLFLTDVSMRNGYFGIIALVMAAAACFTPKSRTRWVIISITLLSLLISFGPYLPLRKWLFMYIPLMNLFRFPSLFRLFFIIGSVLLAASGFERVLEQPARYLKLLSGIIISLLALFLFFAGFELYKYGLAGNYKLLFQNLAGFIDQSLFYQHIIIQSAIQVTLLLILLALVRAKKARYLTVRNVLLLCAVDLIIATQLNAYGTMISSLSSNNIYNKTKNQPLVSAVPNNEVPMLANTDYNVYTEFAPLGGNLNIFKKQIAIDGYNPFVLNNYEQLAESRIRDSVWRNPYLYLSYNMASISDSMHMKTRTTALVLPDVYSRLSPTLLQQGQADNIEVTRFEPGKITATIHNEHNAILVLQQADYPGWSVYADGKRLSHFTTAFANISVVLPAGHHRVQYIFRPGYLYPLLAVSFSSLIAIIISLVMFRKRLF